jgi:aryl-alcohol dehydrogenase-like predicted oxidoreductase
MQSLNNLVKQGKVLYLGISDTPARIVTKANQFVSTISQFGKEINNLIRYARDHGLAQFVIYQGLWNPLNRDVEKDIIPMVLEEGMAFSAW